MSEHHGGEPCWCRDWRPYRAGETVPLPAWFWSWTGRGDIYELTFGIDTAPSRWTHWMPKIDHKMPDPPFKWMDEPRSDDGDGLTMIRTPLHVQILLNAAIIPGPVKDYRAPAVKEYVQALIDSGALERTPNSGDESWVQATKLGLAWLEAICNVPIPRMVYLDGNGKELLVSQRVR